VIPAAPASEEADLVQSSSVSLALSASLAFPDAARNWATLMVCLAIASGRCGFEAIGQANLFYPGNL
jgi:hypothetical protein